MPIPIVTMPEQGKIATRPRRQPVYDTEGDNNSVAIPSKLSFFTRGPGAFQVANLSLTKVFGRDTSFNGSPGQIPKGDVLHWYTITVPVAMRGTDPNSNAGLLAFEEIQRIKMARAFRFNFSDTPYIDAQLDEMPGGCGIRDVMTTNAGAGLGQTIWPTPTTDEASRKNRYDVCVDGFPTVLTELENFNAAFLAASDFLPTPGIELWWSVYLHGTYLKGIRG